MKLAAFTESLLKEGKVTIDGHLIPFTKDDLVIIATHDHGSRYIGKFFNDKWMKEKGFID